MHISKKVLRFSFSGFSLLLIIAMGIINQAYAQLLITPTRIEFADRDRSAKISLVNTSKKITTYKIFWREQAQNESGQYVTLDINDKKFPSASPMLRYSPRQVTLKPGERQHIRLALRRPKEIENAEYRSHLVFEALPNTARSSNKKAKGIQMHLNLAFAIPVIVREGKVAVKTEISNVDLVTRQKNQTESTGAYIDIKREGEFSTFGDVKIYWKGLSKQTERLIGIQRNIAIYRELPMRRLIVGFKDHKKSAGVLRIIYEGIDEYEGQIFSEKIINVNKKNYRLEENYKK